MSTENIRPKRRAAGPRYGLTCGYWTNKSSWRDRHILECHFGTDDPEIYNLTSEDYEGQPLHQCGVMP